MTTTNTLTVESIKAKLLTDDKWLIRGLMAIYNKQTEDEKIVGLTNHNNSVGFSGVDAKILSSFAKFYLKTNFLSPKQIKWARRKMLKYASQLLKIAMAKQSIPLPVSLNPASVNHPLAPVVEKPVAVEPVVDEETLLKQIGQVYCQLSPENLSCDGELPRAAQESRYQALQVRLKELFKKIGREVGEMEAFNAIAP